MRGAIARSKKYDDLLATWREDPTKIHSLSEAEISSAADFALSYAFVWRGTDDRGDADLFRALVASLLSNAGAAAALPRLLAIEAVRLAPPDLVIFLSDAGLLSPIVHAGLLHVLIEHGGDYGDDDKRNPPTHGWEFGRDHLVAKVLLDAGHDHSAYDHLGYTPLTLAAKRPTHWDIVSLLLERGARPDLPTGSGERPINIAVLSGSVPSVEVLLDAGASGGRELVDQAMQVMMADEAEHRELMARCRALNALE